MSSSSLPPPGFFPPLLPKPPSYVLLRLHLLPRLCSAPGRFLLWGALREPFYNAGSWAPAHPPANHRLGLWPRKLRFKRHSGRF